MQKQAVIIYGPPGSGKGTQAELLARKYNFIHFDTGRYIESLVRAPGWQKSAILRRERHLFDTGKLCTPSWVSKISKRFTGQIAELGYSIVYSGFPRTQSETFGKGKDDFMRFLEKLYGKKNITTIRLLVSEKASLARNSHRLVCSVCGLPLLGNAKIKTCTFCAGKMRTRSLDRPEVIKIRLKEYQNRTIPILQGMRKRGFRVAEINGEPLPYKVFESVKKTLKLK
ncbi:MAG: nucleoside monophosphate kinase [Minisyncoccia bacterium]|jgi:adenylate kinase